MVKPQVYNCRFSIPDDVYDYKNNDVICWTPGLQGHAYISMQKKPQQGKAYGWTSPHFWTGDNGTIACNTSKGIGANKQAQLETPTILHSKVLGKFR